MAISGTGPGTERRTLGHLAGIDTARLADRVTLGRLAASTRGNAAEAAAWVRATSAGSLIVVTGYYHMPRTLEELAPLLRGVTLYPFPVGGDQQHRAATRLLFEEYTKYLLARAGLSGWFPTREPPRGVSVLILLRSIAFNVFFVAATAVLAGIATLARLRDPERVLWHAAPWTGDPLGAPGDLPDPGAGRRGIRLPPGAAVPSRWPTSPR